MKEMILKYARYNQWANDKLVTLIKTSAPELIEKEIASSFNSIKKTILHMADAEYIWHLRLTGGQADVLPSKAPHASLDSLALTNRLLIDFISAQGEGFFKDSSSYKSLKGDPYTTNNGAILWHVFNHGTFHRGQIVTMMRNAGFAGPIDQTDFIMFERQ
jgi:uncharacterized damage-inducible protein DinB